MSAIKARNQLEKERLGLAHECSNAVQIFEQVVRIKLRAFFSMIEAESSMHAFSNSYDETKENIGYEQCSDERDTE